MLLHVSNGAYIESICLSERFLVHVEALFAGIDQIHYTYLEYKQTGLTPSFLEFHVKKFTFFFFFLRIQIYSRG